MSEVHDTIDSLIGGVSQQAPALRFKSQAERIENCWLSPTQGLIPRPHTVHREEVFTGKGGAFFPHLIDRDRLERYILLTRQQELLAYDLRGDSYPFRWDGRQLLKDPTDPSTGNWTTSGTLTYTLGASITAEEAPIGGTDDLIQVTIPNANGGARFSQGVTTSDRKLTSGKKYIFWFWIKAGAINPDTTKVQISGLSAGKYTRVRFDWTTTPPQVTYTETGSNTVKDHGVIHRFDDWYVFWMVVDWDSDTDASGLFVEIMPDEFTGALNRTIFLWEMMLEEWDDVLEGPSLLWAPELDTADANLSTNTSYFDFLTANDIQDPETFLDTGSGGAWTLGAVTNAAVVSAFPNPFAWAAGNRFYYQLETQAGVGPFAAYAQTVGTIYPGPQVLLCHARKEDGTGSGFRLNIRDTTLSQSSLADFLWNGTDLEFTEGSLQGAAFAAGVIQSPYDPEDWLFWVAVHPDEHTNVTAGNTRELYVYLNDFDGSETRTGYAWGALLIEGVRSVTDFNVYQDALLRARALTIADFTFLANPDVAVERRGATRLKTPDDPTDTTGYVFVKTGGYDQEYIIRLVYDNGTTTEVYATTWDGDAARGKCIFASGQDQTECQTNGGTWQLGSEEITSSETTEVAAKLAEDLDAVSGVSATATGSVIEIVLTSKKLLRIETEDSQGDAAMIAVHRDVKRVQDLPTIMRDQWRIRIRGQGDEGPGYWLMFVIDGESRQFGEGRWVEATGWEIEDWIDPKTMPHQIVRKQDNSDGEFTGTANQIYFEVGLVNWGRRTVGNNDLNPFPTFVTLEGGDRFIRELFFFSGRLGFLSGESVVLSEVDRFFTFFRSTVIDVNDADAFSATASHTEVSILRQAIVIDERMLVSSDLTQFVVAGDPFVTSQTIQVAPKLSREILRRARWVPSGRGAFAAFPVRADSDDDFEHSGVLEFLPAGTGGTEFLESNISDAVPAYIEGEIVHMAVQTNLGVLFVVTDAGKLFVFQFFRSGGQDLQEAWHEWLSGTDTFAFADFARTEAVFLIRREEGVFLETMRVGENLVDEGLDFLVRLDRRVLESDCVLTYDQTEDETTITLPYDIRTGSSMVAVDRDTGVAYTTKSQTDESPTMVVHGDVTSADLWVGESYGDDVLYEFSKPFLRTQDAGRAIRHLIAGNTLVLNGKLSFNESAAFEVEVEHEHSDTYQDPWNSFVLDTPDAEIDAIVLESGEHVFGIGAAPEEVTIRIKGKGHLPFQILSAVWEGNYAARSSRVRA